MAARAVFITPEPISDRMAGPAIRMYELAAAVSSAVDVTLVSLTGSDRTRSVVSTVAAPTREQLEPVLTGATTVVIQGDVLGLHPWLAGLDIPMVVDMYDPFHLEQLEAARSLGEDRRRAVVRDCVTALNTQLARADFVLCASARQRALWLGHLAALGRINPATYDEDPSLDGSISIVPFGVAQLPVDADGVVRLRERLGVGRDDPLALWGGGVYPWFDVELLVRAMADLRAELPSARLIVLGGGHPVGGPDTSHSRELAKSVASELGVLGETVLFPDEWVPYDERHLWLGAATIGVSTHLDHVETEFSFRTRCLDYLAAGLPIVTSDGDAIADLVRASGCGQVVPPGDRESLVRALRVAFTDPAWLAKAGSSAQRVAGEFGWAAVAAPLVEFCRHPRRAPDLSADAVQRALLGVDRGRRGTAVVRIRAALREGGVTLLTRRARERVGGLARRLSR